MTRRTSRLSLAPDDHSDMRQVGRSTPDKLKGPAATSVAVLVLVAPDAGPADTTPFRRVKVPAIWQTVPAPRGVPAVDPSTLA